MELAKNRHMFYNCLNTCARRRKGEGGRCQKMTYWRFDRSKDSNLSYYRWTWMGWIGEFSNPGSWGCLLSWPLCYPLEVGMYTLLHLELFIYVLCITWEVRRGGGGARRTRVSFLEFSNVSFHENHSDLGLPCTLSPFSRRKNLWPKIKLI